MLDTMPFRMRPRGLFSRKILTCLQKAKACRNWLLTDCTCWRVKDEAARLPMLDTMPFRMRPRGLFSRKILTCLQKAKACRNWLLTDCTCRRVLAPRLSLRLPVRVPLSISRDFSQRKVLFLEIYLQKNIIFLAFYLTILITLIWKLYGSCRLLAQKLLKTR